MSLRKGRNNVQKLREDQLLSKAELARRAGISTLTIDRIEAGKDCRLDTKRKIILGLGLSLAERERRLHGATATEALKRRRERTSMAKGKLALGLDIGSSSVKLAQLKESKRGYSLQSFDVRRRCRPRPSSTGR